jgi:c-di-GMP-binding flagellar brake protein YcgR
MGMTSEYVDARRHARYPFEVEVRVYARNSAVIRGYSVDISESGISAMLRMEVPLDEVVRLEFAAPSGEVVVHALARQRNAFRYGFQFVESEGAQQKIVRTCNRLAVDQALLKTRDP